MGLSAAERNKRKRERKKREKEERRKQEEAEKNDVKKPESADVEIEYIIQPAVADAVPSADQGVPSADGDQKMEEVLRKFQERAAVLVSDDDAAKLNEVKEEDKKKGDDDDDSDGSSDDEGEKISKRKLREMIRPSVAELKRRVQRPDLVEAHDVTAFDPEFLIQLKSIPGAVPVPRHWGRKRKYLQGKVSPDRFVVKNFLSLYQNVSFLVTLARVREKAVCPSRFYYQDGHRRSQRLLKRDRGWAKRKTKK